MNINKYQTFLKVVELGSLTRAAEALGCTQSGVSHTVNSLEEELGFTLLIRSRAGVRLTAEGERVLPAMRSILNGVSQLDQIVAAIRGLDMGVIRVGSFTSVAVRWLPGIIKVFQQVHPKIEFRLLNGDYHDVERWLQDGSIDVGFVALPARVECRTIPLREDRLLAILPRDHPKAKLDRFPLSDIGKEDFISLLKNSDHDARRAMELAGVKPRIKFTTKDDYAIIAMVENGLGVSIVPELLLQGHSDNLRAMELFPGAKRTIALAVPDAAGMSPAVQAFVEYAKRWVDDFYSAS
ncbi:MAG: LysR family transcriptional regulator [Clostridia bacterium]|nr:LysR family transcriptional regulator [Clostridia bacterium]